MQKNRGRRGSWDTKRRIYTAKYSGSNIPTRDSSSLYITRRFISVGRADSRQNHSKHGDVWERTTECETPKHVIYHQIKAHIHTYQRFLNFVYRRKDSLWWRSRTRSRTTWTIVMWHDERRKNDRMWDTKKRKTLTYNGMLAFAPDIRLLYVYEEWLRVVWIAYIHQSLIQRGYERSSWGCFRLRFNRGFDRDRAYRCKVPGAKKLKPVLIMVRKTKRKYKCWHHLRFVFLAKLPPYVIAKPNCLKNASRSLI